jgi:hypothetical protein
MDALDQERNGAAGQPSPLTLDTGNQPVWQVRFLAIMVVVVVVVVVVVDIFDD